MYTLMLMLLHYLVRAGDIHTVSIQEQLPTIKDPCHWPGRLAWTWALTQQVVWSKHTTTTRKSAFLIWGLQ